MHAAPDRNSSPDQPLLQPAPPVSRSVWSCIAVSYFSLILAIVLGTLLSSPFLLTRVRGVSSATFVMYTLPTDDAALLRWGTSLPGVEKFAVDRKGSELLVRWEHLGIQQKPPLQSLIRQMRELGYDLQEIRETSQGLAPGLAIDLTDAWNLAALLVGLQLAFCIVGLAGVRWSGQRGSRWGRPHSASWRQGIAAGAAGGIGLLVLGKLSDLILNAVLDRPLTSPWDVAGQMPWETRLVFLSFGAIGAPLSEEIFFRGYLFDLFRRAGATSVGLLLTSLLFAAAHITDPYNVPVIGLYGIVLAWLYHRTGSLLAPVIAHAVNNGVVILGMFLL